MKNHIPYSHAGSKKLEKLYIFHERWNLVSLIVEYQDNRCKRSITTLIPSLRGTTTTAPWTTNSPWWNPNCDNNLFRSKSSIQNHLPSKMFRIGGYIQSLKTMHRSLCPTFLQESHYIHRLRFLHRSNVCLVGKINENDECCSWYSIFIYDWQ